MEHKTKVAEDLELTEAQAQPADVLRLLNVLLSSECRVEEKKQILEEEFAIKVSKPKAWKRAHSVPRWIASGD